MIIQLKSDIKSQFIPELYFHPEAAAQANTYIKNKVDVFFAQKNIKTPLLISSKDLLGDTDFSRAEFSIKDYFYPVFFSDIKKDENGTIKSKIFYGVTFDKDCEDKTIMLAKKPIFYYVYIDLQEMFRFLKNRDRS